MTAQRPAFITKQKPLFIVMFYGKLSINEVTDIRNGEDNEQICR